MAHNAQAVFFQTVKEAYPDYFAWSNVLEVGSLDINGTIRGNFYNCNYVGCDLDFGPGVDIAVQGQEVAFRDGSMDVVASAECFEHNPYWSETFINMKRMLRPGGLFVFTCAGKDRPEHGTARTDAGSSPLTTAAGWDYYKNLEESDFQPSHLHDLNYQFFYNEQAKDLYFVAIKTHTHQGRKVELVDEVDWNA